MKSKWLQFSTIRLVLLCGGLLFLFSFTNNRNNERTLKEVNIEFVGNEFLFITHDSVNKLLIEKNTKLSDYKKVHLDLKQLENKITQHPFVQQSEIYLSVDGQLYARVEQKRPIARVFSMNEVFYIDENGTKMPVSESYSARVPVFSGAFNEENKNSILKVLQAIDRDVFLTKQIVGIELLSNGNFKLRNRAFDFEIDFGKPVNVHRKFANYKAFFQKAVRNQKMHEYKKINLRFTEQVVCTKS
jgi:cell division protein FtsQ